MPPFTSSAVPARRTVLFLHDAVDTVGRDCEQPVLQPFDPSLLAQIPQMKLEIVRREAENLFQLNETHTTALQIRPVQTFHRGASVRSCGRLRSRGHGMLAPDPKESCRL